MYQSWSLEALERKLEQMEIAGLDGTDEYKALDELACEKAAAKLAAEAAYRQELKEKALARNLILQAIEEGNEELAIQLGGEEFMDDYEVFESNGSFVVKSLVAHAHQNSEHEFDTIEEANKKYRNLIAWRIYDHYKRG